MWEHEYIFNEDGSVNYGKVTITAEGVMAGTDSIQRLERGGEEGRLQGGRLLVEASLVIGGATSSGKTIGRSEEESLLEGFAKERGACSITSTFSGYQRSTRFDPAKLK